MRKTDPKLVNTGSNYFKSGVLTNSDKIQRF